MRRSARLDSRVDAALLIACLVAALILLALPAPPRRALATALRATVVAPLATLQANAELSRRSFLAHDSVAVVADSVRLRAMRLDAVEAENARLRGLLGLAAALRWGFVPAEVLAGRGLGEEFTATVTAGRRAGVERFSPVVAPEGLVGMVEAADEAIAQVIVWPHPDFRVSAMTADGSTYGIVAAHLAPGAERFLLELRGIPFRSVLKPGTRVVSSGLGGTYPRGIPVGTVLAELRTSEGWARSYLLQPAVRLPEVSSVMVLRPERARAGLEGVWTAPGSRADAEGRAAAAGDSLRADSVRRATPVLTPVPPRASGGGAVPAPASTASPARAPEPPAAPAAEPSDSARRRP